MMRHVCEAMGLSWGSQRDKLTNSEVFSCTDISTTGSDGKQYQMLAMPVEDFPLWLVLISAQT